MMQDLVVYRRLHRLRGRRAARLRHRADLGRAQAGGDHVRPHRREPRLRAHSVHAGQARLVGPVPRPRRRPQDDAEGGLRSRIPTTASPTRSRRGSCSRRCCSSSRSFPSAARSSRPSSACPPLAALVRRPDLSDADRARSTPGLLVVFAFGGLTIIGAMLAGWSSANKFSLLGALRAGSQMISYELIMGLTVLGLILIYGTVDLNAIARQQSGVLLGFLPAWGIFLPALRGDPLPDRGHRREQAHPVRPAGGRVGAHRRLLTPSTAR